jgi:hypothetical protein
LVFKKEERRNLQAVINQFSQMIKETVKIRSHPLLQICYYVQEERESFGARYLSPSGCDLVDTFRTQVSQSRSSRVCLLQHATAFFLVLQRLGRILCLRCFPCAS